MKEDNKFKSIDKQTLNDLMLEQLRNNYANAVENNEETIIGINDLMNMWDKVSEYEHGLTDIDQKDNYKKLLAEIKNIISDTKDD